MLRELSIGLALILIATASFAQQGWFWQNPLPTGNCLSCIHFTDAATGWAVGEHGTILHTTDGGSTWTPQTSGTSNHLEGVHFTDANTAWAVGYAGTIVHTTDGGTSCTPQTSGISTWLYDVHFTDANTGWTVGAYGTIVHTTDGGTSWTPQTSGTAVLLRGVHFTDATTGWAVGWYGEILHTTDGGSTWTPQTSGTLNHLEDAHFIDANTGWAVGWDGTILHTTTGGSTSIEEDDNFVDLPLTVSLVQPYPNPFNRQTAIQYTLPKKSTVTIRIYNALGQEVRVLVDEFQQAGIYSAVWDSRDRGGRKVSSGTYFLRLEAEEQSIARKVCVVR